MARDFFYSNHGQLLDPQVFELLGWVNVCPEVGIDSGQFFYALVLAGVVRGDVAIAELAGF